MKRLFQLILSLALLLHVQAAAADRSNDTLRIVTAEYPPFVFQQGQSIAGADWEVVKAVFKQMGIPVKLRFCPWKRCLLQIRTGKADAILDVSRTPEREKNMIFPDEYLSKSVVVFFKRVDETVPFHSLNDLSQLTIGARSGYDYCDEVSNPPFRVERGRNLEINMNKLIHKRIDLALASYPVGQYMTTKMEIAHLVDLVPGAVVCSDYSLYLAFSKRGARHFSIADISQALREFKQTDEYKKILARYGIHSAPSDGRI